MANLPWDEVDEAGDESFPASDPPAWGSWHATTVWASALPPEPQPAWRFGRGRALIALAVLASALVAIVAFEAIRRRR